MNESVASKVGPPGIALALFGLGSIATHLLLGLGLLASSLSSVLVLLGGASTAADFQAFLMGTGWQLVAVTGGFFVSFVVTFAGLRLRSARSAWLIYLGSIAAMLPCCVNCCCVIGLPLAIWVLVVMQDEAVKAAFAENF
jgi:hypothetical protein